MRIAFGSIRKNRPWTNIEKSKRNRCGAGLGSTGGWKTITKDHFDKNGVPNFVLGTPTEDHLEITKRLISLLFPRNLRGLWRAGREVL